MLMPTGCNGWPHFDDQSRTDGKCLGRGNNPNTRNSELIPRCKSKYAQLLLVLLMNKSILNRHEHTTTIVLCVLYMCQDLQSYLRYYFPTELSLNSCPQRFQDADDRLKGCSQSQRVFPPDLVEGIESRPKMASQSIIRH